MRDKVILGITLTIVLLGTLAVYGAVDFLRVPNAQAQQLQKQVSAGRATYALYCIQCHGPKGEGCIGPALNRTTWRAQIDGAANPDFDKDATATIINTIDRGRASNQPGIAMPAWGEENGGALNDEQIQDVVDFIQYGDWDTALQYAASAANLDKDIPSYPGFTGDVAQVKQTMLAKGCLNCHTMGTVGGKVAADLTYVGSRRSADWLAKWIKNPSAMPASMRGPNLWLIGPTPSLFTPSPNAPPTATAQAYPMNTTFMPTIPMTDDELNLLVSYLSQARLQ